MMLVSKSHFYFIYKYVMQETTLYMSCVIKPTITLCVIKINKAVTLRAEMS